MEAAKEVAADAFGYRYTLMRTKPEEPGLGGVGSATGNGHGYSIGCGYGNGNGQGNSHSNGYGYNKNRKELVFKRIYTFSY
jgi:hypothetical protein